MTAAGKGQHSSLPRMWDVAELLSTGTTTLPELAERYGVSVRAITQRLNLAGFSRAGEVLGRSRLNSTVRPLVASDTGAVHYVQGRDHVELPFAPVVYRRYRAVA